MLVPGSLELYQGNWGVWCGQAPYGLGMTISGESVEEKTTNTSLYLW